MYKKYNDETCNKECCDIGIEKFVQDKCKLYKEYKMQIYKQMEKIINKLQKIIEYMYKII